MAVNSSTSNSKTMASYWAIISFVITVIVGNVLLVVAAPHFDSNYSLMRDINSSVWQDSGDTFFLGDSRTHQGLIPELFDQVAADNGVSVESYNLARPGMQLPFAYYHAKRVVEESPAEQRFIVMNISFYLLGGQQWMEDIYFSYYRPSIWEAYDACQTQLMTCYKAAQWWFRTRIPMWLYGHRADTMATALIGSPSSLLNEIQGISDQQRKSNFQVAKGYLSRGEEHISEQDITPHAYTTGIERGYSNYFAYLERLIELARQNDIKIFVYRFPWPEARQHQEGFDEVLDYYWSILEKYESDHFILIENVDFWPNELFVDPLHVNHPGAIRLTETVAERVARHLMQ